MRPCMVGDNRCLFHKWVDTEYALVEFESGRIEVLPIYSIIFVDTKDLFSKFNFEDFSRENHTL